MKKLLVSLVLVGVIAAVFGFTGAVHAQGPNNTGGSLQWGNGAGFGSGTLLRDRIQLRDGTQNEDVHNLMIAAWADELGLSGEDIEARLDAGETLSQIALSTGLTFDEFWTLKTTIHTTVADQALAAGYITQAQYDWMKLRAERQATMQGYRAGSGTGTYGGFGGRGMGLRMMDGTGANCPNN